eukprot:gene2-3_t
MTHLDEQEKLCQLALSYVQGVGFSTWRNLIAHFKTAKAIFANAPCTLKEELPGILPHILAQIISKHTFVAAEKSLITHQKQGIQSISFFDDVYPARLKHTYHPPCFLFTQGNIPFESAKVVSIVGTRKATNYGKEVVEKLIKGLSSYGEVVVVSGLAYGIDVHAHTACLQIGLSTVGVLAGSLDRIYPAVHKNIALKMLEKGGLVSELPVSSTVEAFQFPKRNRIIAGLSDATLVIEAGAKSGTSITAKLANDCNREVLAVPGPIDAPYSIGCNELIKTQQAHLLTSVEDYSALKAEEQALLEKLQVAGEEVHMDLLSYGTNFLIITNVWSGHYAIVKRDAWSVSSSTLAKGCGYLDN